MRRPIWGYAVCLCPIKGTPGLNELKIFVTLVNACLSYTEFYFFDLPYIRPYFVVVIMNTEFLACFYLMLRYTLREMHVLLDQMYKHANTLK